MSVIIKGRSFDLAETLDCGQAFRWEKKEDDLWHGIALDHELTAGQKGDEITLNCSEEEFESFWKDYFDLSEDYRSIKKRLSEMSPVLREASSYAPGIRILKQDHWEAMCSFIISQNNNIPRIKGIIERLCENFGEKQKEYYSFPSAERIAALEPEDLAPIRCGFRAKYLIAGARAVTGDKNFLKDIETLPVDEARKRLQTVKGIGPKVADCTLLYGFHRTECFPLDVWMKRAMAELLPENKPEDFGLDAGIAQQYIFHYSRMHPELFEHEES